MRTPMSTWEKLAYPIVFEGKIEGEDWQFCMKAESVADIEFRLMSVPLIGDRFRIRDAVGRQWEVDRDEIIKSNEEVEESIFNRLKPLETLAAGCDEKTVAAAEEIITGAQTSQHFQIPDRAVVQIGHPALDRIELLEYPDSVVALLHTEQGLKLEDTAAVTIHKALADRFYFVPDTASEKVKAFAYLICGSVVRDFWVLEERSRGRVYQKRTEKKRERVGRGKDRKLVVEKSYTFIPRFKYTLEGVGQEISTPQARQVRVSLSPHIVSGHFRKLPENWKVSEQAKQHAEEFGLTLADGYTFVRPHKRGEIQQMRTYRSRSAFELIFTTDSDIQERKTP